MAFHQIQCPHCFTDYTITEEQYRSSEGMVRCGTCREQFTAMVVTDGAGPPKFDPREVFIEPLSEPLPAADGGDIKLSEESEHSYVSYEKSIDPNDEADIELMSTHEFEYTGPAELLPKELLEVSESHIKSDKLGDSDELSTSEILKNLRSKSVRDTSSSKSQNLLDLEHSQERNKSGSSRQEALNNTEDKDNILIDQVDTLVDKKLMTAAAKPLKKKKPRASSNKAKPKLAEQDFFLEPRKRKRKRKQRGGLTGFIIALCYLMIALILTAALAYQLWLKQLIKLPEDNAWLNTVLSTASPHLETLKKTLSSYDIELPERRNLSQLELLSARTEPHPSRDNTVLLKISVVNRATIAQALPWLEMSLTDTNGDVVARRNLSPDDYIYNNQTSSEIGPNQLKRVTIELLSFPKSATGFEIKLLDN